MRMWLARAENVNAGIETFGPFVCDAALAPVLHVVLRSEWVAERKERSGSGQGLKPGWAQEFYDSTRVAVTSVGTPVFVQDPRCALGSSCTGDGECGRIASSVLNEMRWCGYMPWSAVHAVRSKENELIELPCSGCQGTLLTYCVFLMEHAALEAATSHDWLVRNEAVIQLCWAIGGIHHGFGGGNAMDAPYFSGHLSDYEWEYEDEGFQRVVGSKKIENGLSEERSGDCQSEREKYKEGAAKEKEEEEEEEDEEKLLLKGWTESIVAHCMAFQIHERQHARVAPHDVDQLTVMYAIDHLPICPAKARPDSSGAVEREDIMPDPELIRIISLNEQFSSSTRKRGSLLQENDLRVPPAGEVLVAVPNDMEVTNRDPDTVADCIVSFFPRVSPSALSDLSLKAPEPSALRFDSRIFWPVFVNPTRACYPLFKSVALPVAPNPVYALEMLARSWRRVPRGVLEGFVPAASGGKVKIERSHYERHFVAPLTVLSEIAAIGSEEKNLMLEVLSRGVLPCFASCKDSVVDRTVSSTLALSFAACGLRLLDSEPEASQAPGSGVLVSVAGLLYFAAWYVLVYASALHTGPEALKVRLSRSGTDADKLLCGALKLVRCRIGSTVEDEEEQEQEEEEGYSENDLLCGYSVRDYRERDVTRALLIVFDGLLDTRTVLRAAQLYVPELTAQLPYLRRSSKIPDSVRSAIEGRDVWLETLRGEDRLSQSDEPPFVYVGDVAHELHSSVRGALFKPYNRRVAAPPPRHDDQEFDPWYDCMLILDPEAECESHELMVTELAAIARTGEEEDDRSKVAGNTGLQEYIVSDFEKMTIRQDDDNQTYIDLDKRAPSMTDEQRENDTGSIADTETQLIAQGTNERSRRVCHGLYVAETESMGFKRENVKRFLSQAKDSESLEMRPRGESSCAAHKLRNPCMANIAQTVYTKISRTETNGMGEHLGREPHHRCHTLIEALWMLLVGAHRREESSTTQEQRFEEPYTVEALAVMVHLAVKSFGSIDTTKLGACNNMEVLYQDVCHEEKKFIPIAAITGGLFGVNLQIYAKGYCYHIINRHYGNTWPVGSLEYKDGTGWLLRNLPFGRITSKTPSEPDVAMRCHHGGTYRAYTRLNGLRVIEVGSDGYCGFHAISTLINGTREVCGAKRRKELAEKTAAFVHAQKRRPDIVTYLRDNKLLDAPGLVRHLTQHGRWLDVQDVKYILEAHGKTLRLITENSYPLYEATCAYVLIKSSHYEPLLPV